MKTLWWVLTRQCNLACSYCYQGEHIALPKDHGLLPKMPNEVLQTALPWALKWGNPGGLRINLYGGEPLLNFPVIEQNVPIWKWAFKQNNLDIAFSMTTNGTKLKGKVRDFMDEHKVGILLSIDGPKHLHDVTRVHYDGRKSWDEINPEELLSWRPNLEIAWQLDPKTPFEPDDIDHMLGLGFKIQNYNVNWLAEWDDAAQLRLQRFFKRAGRLMHQGKLQGFWKNKLKTALEVDSKMDQPCGTGLGMLALTPEGKLFPSQEMAFTVYEPGRAAGTPEYYTVGDVRKDPVIRKEDLARTSDIKVSQMKAAPGFDCDDCIAKSMCISGCHCRYVGQDSDPASRFQAPDGYCKSTRSAMTGLLQAAAIERYVRPVDFVTAKVKREMAAATPSIPQPEVVKVTPKIQLARPW